MGGDSASDLRPICPVRQISAGGRSALRKPLDFDPDTGRVRNDIQLLNPYTDGPDAAIFKSERCDPFGQGFDEPQMTLRDDRPDAIHDMFVVHDIFKTIAYQGGIFADRQVDIDPDRLGPAFLVPMDADMGIEDQIAHKDMANRIRGRGDVKRLGYGVAGHAGDLA